MTAPVTGTLFYTPNQQPLSSNGTPQAGMQAFFYVTGTLTPTPVYADAGLTTPLSNPVTADATGTFVAIYIDPTVLTKVILKTSTGVQLAVADPINVSGSAVSGGAITFSPDGGGVIAQVRGGSFVTSVQPGGVIMGTNGSPLVNTGVNSAQFCFEVVTDSTSAPGTAVQCFIGRNVSTNSAAVNYCFEAGNDVIGNEMIVGTTSSSFSGALFTGGPTGEQKFIGCPAAKPIVIGNNGKAALIITAAQGIQGVGPVAGAAVDMTPDTGTFLLTATGFSGSVTGTASWVRMGNIVLLFLPGLAGTSNATSFTATGLPSAIQPSRTLHLGLPFGAVEDSGVVGKSAEAVLTAASGTIAFWNAGSASGWTGTGTKGIVNGGCQVAYALN